MIVKILTFGFSACASIKADDAAKHKLQADKLQDENKDRTKGSERSWLVTFNMSGISQSSIGSRQKIASVA